MTAHALQHTPRGVAGQVAAKPLPATEDASLAAELVSVRRVAGLSQEQAAKAMGVTRQYLAKCEDPLTTATLNRKHLRRCPRMAAAQAQLWAAQYDPPRLDSRRAALKVQRELLEATEAELDADADGERTGDELGRIRREADDVVRAALDYRRAVG